MGLVDQDCSHLFDRLRRTGRDLDAELRGRDLDQDCFVERAVAHLVALDAFTPPDPVEIYRFVTDNSTLQEPANRFSDLPLVVYRGRSFFIEVLLWQSATAEIHQHAFYGAFKVIAGGSLHTEYSYSPERGYGELVSIGEVTRNATEFLRTGDVRTIRAGPTARAHSLVHLGTPSVTVVIRTYTLPWLEPQRVLLRSGVALAESELAADKLCLACIRLAAACPWGAEMSRLTMEMAETLDLARFIAVWRSIVPRESERLREQVAAVVRRRWPNAADVVMSGLLDLVPRNRLMAARAVVESADERLVLAVLATADDWQHAESLLLAAMSDVSPRLVVAEFIAKRTCRSSVDLRISMSAFETALLFCDVAGLQFGDRVVLLAESFGGHGAVRADGRQAAFLANVHRLPELAMLWR